MKNLYKLFGLLVVLSVLLSACGGSANTESTSLGLELPESKLVEYSLVSTMLDGQMAFIGDGGGIDGVKNPTLSANVGDTVRVTLIGGDAVEHDVAFPDFNAQSDHISGKGSTSTFEFGADKPGSFAYSCLLAGHKEAGMIGKFEVTGEAPMNHDTSSAPANSQVVVTGPVVVNNPATTGADIVRDPTDIPAQIEMGVREPQTVRIDLETVEIEGQLADGTTYKYWTFNGKVPGPFYRVRVGDTIEVHLKNLTNSTMAHSVDFHAVTGPGGGAASNTVIPGASATIEVRLLYPGLFMYHCAFGDVPEPIVRGRFGGVLVDPETPLPAVEHELYMVQSEFYTMPGAAEGDPLVTDRPAVTMEHPTYVVFNGARGSLMGENAPRIQVGERMRIYFVNAGLNLISSFHAIGSHWDKVYQEGTLFNPPLRGSQTTLVPAGGSTIVELIGQVPATLVLVDHALARAFDKGAIGQVIVEGEPTPAIFEAFAPAASPMPGAMH